MELSGGSNRHNDFVHDPALQIATLGEAIAEDDLGWQRLFAKQQQLYQLATEITRRNTILTANVNEFVVQQFDNRTQLQPQALPQIPVPIPEQTQARVVAPNKMESQVSMLVPKKRPRAETLRAPARRSYSTHKRLLRTIITTEARTTCEICTDEVSQFQVVELRCNHTFCLSCLAEMFKRAITSADNYPPRCCEPIPISYATEALTATELETFFEVDRKLKANNSTTVYCFRESCGRPLPSHHIEGRIGVCLDCNELTCAMCTKKYHGDAWCQDDPDAQALIEVAKKNRWQRCYQCWRIVELKHGCYHITCRCHAQFCYVCGTKWKRCNCNSAEQFVLLGGGTTGNTRRDAGSMTELINKGSSKLWDRHRKLEEAYVKERQAQLEGLEYLRKKREKDRETVMLRIEKRKRVIKEKHERSKQRAEERALARRTGVKPARRKPPASRNSYINPVKIEPAPLYREIRPKSISPEPVLANLFAWLISTE